MYSSTAWRAAAPAGSQIGRPAPSSGCNFIAFIAGAPPGGRAAGRPAATMPGMEGWRARYHRYSTRLYRPSPHTTWLSWIGDERLAIGNLPTGATLSRLPEI